MDRFTEQIVVKKNRTANEVMYYLSFVVMLISGFLALLYVNLIMYSFEWPGSIPAIIETVLLAAIAVLLFLFRNRLRTDYEYTFTNGDLDFAMVFNNQKRKNLGTLKVRNIEAFGPVTGNSFRRYVSMKDIKKYNWFMNRGAELYYFYFQKETSKKMIIFEPNEEMVEYIKQYLPHGAVQD